MPQNTILMVTENAYRSMKLIALVNVLSITTQRAYSHYVIKQYSTNHLVQHYIHTTFMLLLHTEAFCTSINILFSMEVESCS